MASSTWTALPLSSELESKGGRETIFTDHQIAERIQSTPLSGLMGSFTHHIQALRTQRELVKEKIAEAKKIKSRANNYTTAVLTDEFNKQLREQFKLPQEQAEPLATLEEKLVATINSELPPLEKKFSEFKQAIVTILVREQKHQENIEFTRRKIKLDLITAVQNTLVAYRDFLIKRQLWGKKQDLFIKVTDTFGCVGMVVASQEPYELDLNQGLGITFGHEARLAGQIKFRESIRTLLAEESLIALIDMVNRVFHEIYFYSSSFKCPEARNLLVANLRQFMVSYPHCFNLSVSRVHNTGSISTVFAEEALVQHLVKASPVALESPAAQQLAELQRPWQDRLRLLTLGRHSVEHEVENALSLLHTCQERVCDDLQIQAQQEYLEIERDCEQLRQLISGKSRSLNICLVLMGNRSMACAQAYHFATHAHAQHDQTNYALQMRNAEQFKLEYAKFTHKFGSRLQRAEAIKVRIDTRIKETRQKYGESTVFSHYQIRLVELNTELTHMKEAFHKEQEKAKQHEETGEKLAQLPPCQARPEMLSPALPAVELEQTSDRRSPTTEAKEQKQPAVIQSPSRSALVLQFRTPQLVITPDKDPCFALKLLLQRVIINNLLFWESCVALKGIGGGTALEKTNTTVPGGIANLYQLTRSSLPYSEFLTALKQELQYRESLRNTSKYTLFGFGKLRDQRLQDFYDTLSTHLQKTPLVIEQLEAELRQALPGLIFEKTPDDASLTSSVSRCRVE